MKHENNADAVHVGQKNAEEREPKSMSPKKSNKSVSRRQFIGGVTAGAAALSLQSLQPIIHAAPGRPGQVKTLVVIYLRGGQDALNTVIPYADPIYKQLRPGIGIPASDTEEMKGVIKLDEQFGLHPAAAALKPLYDKKLFAPVVCVGSPHPTRSHFDAQDFMEYAAPGVRTMKDGWLNRYLANSKALGEDSGLRALAMQKLLPRSLRGDYPVLAVPTRNRREVEGALDMFDELYGSSAEMGQGMDPGMKRREETAGSVQVGRDTIETLRRLYTIMDNTDGTSRVNYGRGGLARGLQNIARVIKSQSGLEVACVDLGGWDTHTNQGGSTGGFATRLQGVCEALAGFTEDLGPQMKNVTCLVMTEFGRTARENGNSGTDHGHGSCLFAVGGQVNGGKVYGTWPGLDENMLYQGRDLQATTDFRVIMDEALKSVMGYTPHKKFFPKYEAPRRSLKLFS